MSILFINGSPNKNGNTVRLTTIVIGSPLYWHSMSGAIRNILDRFYGYVDESLLQGKDMYFVFQGYAPTKEQLAAGEYTMSRFAKLYGMNYKGMITE